MADYQPRFKARALYQEPAPTYYLDDDDSGDDSPAASGFVGNLDPQPGSHTGQSTASSGDENNRHAFLMGSLWDVNARKPSGVNQKGSSGRPHITPESSGDENEVESLPRGSDEESTSQSPSLPPSPPLRPASASVTKERDGNQSDRGQIPPPHKGSATVSSSIRANSTSGSTAGARRAASMPWLFHPWSNDNTSSKDLDSTAGKQREPPPQAQNASNDNMTNRFKLLAAQRKAELLRAAQQQIPESVEEVDKSEKTKKKPPAVKNGASGSTSSTSNRFTELAALRKKEIQQAAQNARGKAQEPESDSALKEDYEHALNELEQTREDRDNLSSENSRLENEIRLLRQQIQDFSTVITSKEDETTDLKKQVKKLARVVKTEHEEPMVLRDRLDQAHYKLRKAERRNRYVDDTDRWKADAKYRKKQKDTGVLSFGFPSYEADEHKDDVLKERRGAQGLVAKSATEVISMMMLFNHSLFQTSASLVRFIGNRGIQHAAVSSAVAERARKVLGARVVYTVLENLPKLQAAGGQLNPLLPQIVLQVFLVFWCNSIIEAWYPKQATFAEFLVDICSKIKVGSNQNICGTKTLITQSHTRDSVNLFTEWAQDVIDDLHQVLSVFGWEIAGYYPIVQGRRGPNDVHDALFSLIKEAYDLRTAMAEISTSGDVDLTIISYDTPFNARLMEDEYGDQRKAKKASATGKKNDSDDDDSSDELDVLGRSTVERVVGTTGIGLQREVMKSHIGGLMKRDIEMVLKPRVALEASLLEAFEQP